MASLNPPVKNEAYTFYVSLASQANTKVFQANPTLAAGDVKVATDDGSPGNAATLPAVDADFTKRVKVSLSAGEMNGDNVSVIFSDASGDEWCDLTVNIQTVTSNQFDDLATAAALATVDGIVDDILVDTGTTIPGQITGLNDLSAAEVNAEVDTALGDYDAPTKAELDSGLAGLNDPTAAAIADAVWDEALTGASHNIATSAGRRLRQLGDAIASTVDDAGATATDFDTALAGSYADNFFNDQVIRFTTGDLAGQTRIVVDYTDSSGNIVVDEAMTAAPGNGDEFDIIPSHVHPVSQIADAVWDEATAGHTTAGTFGEQVKTDVDAILADTDELQTDNVPGLIATLATAAALATVDANVDSILADTGTDGVAIATATAQAIADELLKRGIDNVEDAADVLSLAAIVLATLESEISGTTWTIRKSDGTDFTTKTLTVDADADPITGVT